MSRTGQPSSVRGERWLLVPYASGLILLILVPVLLGGWLAFTDANLMQPPAWVGFDNFTNLLDDQLFRLAVRNSLEFIAWAVPLRFIGAVGLALLLHARFVGAKSSRTAVMLPTVMPDVAYALVWIWILNPFYGPMNLLLGAFGVHQPMWLTTPANARMAVIIMSVFQLGEGFVIALAARQMIPKRYYELAAVEGAGAWTTFRRLTLPVMLPALMLLLVRDTVVALQGTFVPGLMVTGGGPPPGATTYIPLFVYREAFHYLKFGEAAAATLLMVPVTASIVWLEFQIVGRWRRDTEG